MQGWGRGVLNGKKVVQSRPWAPRDIFAFESNTRTYAIRILVCCVLKGFFRQTRNPCWFHKAGPGRKVSRPVTDPWGPGHHMVSARDRKDGGGQAWASTLPLLQLQGEVICSSHVGY
jgi:hypothetical protein